MSLTNRLLFTSSPIVSAGMGMLAIPLMTWTMSSKDIAMVGLFQYASSAMLIAATCGLDQAYLRELETTKYHGALLRRSLTPPLVILLLVALATYLFGDHLSNQRPHEISKPLLALLILNVTLLTVQRFGAQKARMDNLGASYFLSESVIRLPLTLLLIYATISSSATSDSKAIIAIVSGTALSATVLLTGSWSTWKLLLSQKADRTVPTLKILLKFGTPLAFAGVLYWALSNQGAYFTQLFHGHESSSRLIVAMSIANVATLGQIVFSLMWLPKIFRKINYGIAPEEIGNIARTVTVGAAVLYTLATIAIHGVQHILGKNYRDIAPLAAALCVLPALYTISEVSFIGIMIKKRSGLALLASATGLTAGLIANISLTPFLGEKGAAIATAIAAFVFFTSRTELAGKAWNKIPTSQTYFGVFSITAAGITANLASNDLAPVYTALLLPYLWHERRTAKELIESVLKKLAKCCIHKNPK